MGDDLLPLTEACLWRGSLSNSKTWMTWKLEWHFHTFSTMDCFHNAFTAGRIALKTLGSSRRALGRLLSYAFVRSGWVDSTRVEHGALWSAGATLLRRLCLGLAGIKTDMLVSSAYHCHSLSLFLWLAEGFLSWEFLASNPPVVFRCLRYSAFPKTCLGFAPLSSFAGRLCLALGPAFPHRFPKSQFRWERARGTRCEVGLEKHGEM